MSESTDVLTPDRPQTTTVPQPRSGGPIDVEAALAAALAAVAQLDRVPVGAAQYVLCGALQFLAFLGYSYVIALVITRGTEWMLKAATSIDIYVR